MKKRLFFTIMIAGLITVSCIRETNNISVVNLTCEYLDTPLGIDVTEPRFAWKIIQTAEAENNQLQTAYQIIVASSPEKLAADEGDIWNSEKVKSGQSTQVVYAGKPLISMQQCFWKVKIWNNHGEVSSWSEPAHWGMGILNPEDWQAQWIGDQPDIALKEYVDYVDKHHDKKDYDPKIAENPPRIPSPMLRKMFDVKGENIKNAYLYVSALGDYKIFINGERIGDHQLAPEWTDYYKRVQYQVYDLTGKIRTGAKTSGANVLSAILADGWYLGELGPVRWIWGQAFPFRGFYGLDRRLIAQLVIEQADGSKQIVATDDSWKINPDGFIRSADNFVGETIDARKRVPGWEKPEFDDSKWANVYVDKVDKNLEAQKNEPIRIHHELNPVEITTWEDKYIVNFGQNIAGWCALKVKGKAGDVITLRHGEWINDDGSIYTLGLGQAKETDVFILSGAEEGESFEPSFTYHGFQYVEVSSSSPDFSLRDFGIMAKAVASDPEVTGTFECSNPKLNQLFSNILWTQRNNLHSVPTDCPQRDERCGWLGDAQIFCQNSIFNMNMAGFYTKFIKDMRDAVAPNGQFYSIVPSVKHGNFGMDWYGGPAWSDAGLIVPWIVYENYADVQVLKDHYLAMKRYVESILTENPGLIWKIRHASYNDWLNANTFSNPPEDYNTTRGNMPDDVFSTAYFANSAYLLSKTAAVLGYQDDAAKYSELTDKIKDVFVKNFVDENGKIAGNSQGAYALSLNFNLLPENLRASAFNNLIECIKEYDYRISTGFTTTLMMMKELVRYGRTDIAYKLLESERFPSWIYAINQGATTVWERWDAYVKGRGIHPSSMNSFDHYSIGSVGEWIYRNVLGINPDSEYPGYEHFTIQPRPGGTLTWAKGSYNSIRGEIATSWKIENGKFILKVKIPANSTATVVLPNGKIEETGSGEYEFTVINVKQ